MSFLASVLENLLLNFAKSSVGMGMTLIDRCIIVDVEVMYTNN